MANDFFRRVVREIPWLHIRAFEKDPDHTRAVQFKTRGSFDPEKYEWSFGDGSTSPVSEPAHTYDQDGTYTVTLIATTTNGQRVKRSTRVHVPLARFRHTLDR